MLLCHSQAPEAPTYYPTEEQFKDPFAYIASIREEAQKFGIARIVPPASWNPPFALEKGTDGRIPDSFRFTTRKQFTSHLCMRAPRSFGQQGGSSGGAPEEGQQGGGDEPISPVSTVSTPLCAQVYMGGGGRPGAYGIDVCHRHASVPQLATSELHVCMPGMHARLQ
jgi:hypothetical protein